MDTQKLNDTTTTQTQAGTGPPIVPIEPEELVTELRAFRQRIPDYGQITTLQAGQLRRAAAVKPALVYASINAIGASETVQGAVGSTPKELLDVQNDAARWSAVEDELRAMLKGVSAANLARRHFVGFTALQAYGVSRRLVRQKEHADLLPHVDEMKRLNRRRKKDEKPSDPAPQGQTPVPSPSQS
jgi:hypothetical protein